MSDIPRVLLRLYNGFPTVVAVEGTVQVIIADFDREGQPALTRPEIEALFQDSVYAGGAHAFDMSADFEKELLLTEVGEEESLPLPEDALDPGPHATAGAGPTSLAAAA